MAHVDIKVNGKAYTVTCEDGQEQRLTELAIYLDRHVAGLAETLGEIGEVRLLLLASLTLCDELFETRAELFSKSEAEKSDAQDGAAALHLAEEQIELAVSRISTITDRLRAAG